MRGYDSSTYGRAFVDVYDDWYGSITDVDRTVEFLTALLTGAATGRNHGEDDVTPARRRRGSVVELGVGTGRLAIPLASAGRDRDPGFVVCGIDSSPEMLAALADRDHDRLVHTVLGDMVADLRSEAIELATGGTDGVDLVLVAYNTLFNILSGEGQSDCFAAVADVLRPGGRFVVEAFVPDAEPIAEHVGIKSMTADRVVLTASRHGPDQRSEGHFIELTDAGGVRLRPWAIRWSTIDQLDAMAHDAGLSLERRLADFDGTAFDDDADRHVSVYRRPPS